MSWQMKLNFALPKSKSMLTSLSNSTTPSTSSACPSVWARDSLPWNTPHWTVTRKPTTPAAWTFHSPTSKENPSWWPWKTSPYHPAAPAPPHPWSPATCFAHWAAATRAPTAVSALVLDDSPQTRKSTTCWRLSRLACLSCVSWARFGSWYRRVLTSTRLSGASIDFENLEKPVWDGVDVTTWICTDWE